MRFYRAVDAAALHGVTEAVPAARTVLITFNPLIISRTQLIHELECLTEQETAISRASSQTVDVVYEGEDLETVAKLLGMSAEEIIQRHLAANWQVAFSGFAPGFGYLAGDDPVFQVPRKSSPRTRVPAGSVGLAGEFTGVYPQSSPGGWQLIGHTETELWNLDRDPPALLVPGTEVKFQRASRARVQLAPAPTARAAKGARAHPACSDDGRAFTVLDPGLQLLVQDLGRPGFAALGVAAAGAADRGALSQANRLVGNNSNAPALESLGGNFSLRVAGAGVAAISGAPGDVTVTADSGTVYHHSNDEPFALESGDTVQVGAATRGLRRYLAFRGGIDASATLGSTSTDTLAKLGPKPLRKDDRFSVNAPHTAPQLVLPASQIRSFASAPQRQHPRAGETVTLSICLGPRDNWFTPEALETLITQEWCVTGESDRVGLRLAGETALERVSTEELPSEGVVTGALQVPPSGQPVLFGPDHPLTGGYPIIASVIDTDFAAQLAPGVKLRFTTVENDHTRAGTHHFDRAPERSSSCQES
jgi:KipI family sensor histidine kinase inhibitor